MLLSLRDRVKGSKVLGTAVVVIISIPFALFGIGSYLGGGGNNFAAKVNDEEISIRSYEQNYQAQHNQLRAAFGGTIPAGFDSAALLRRQALETSIAQRLLLQHTQVQGYAVGDAAVAAALYNEQAFQEDEEFSKQRYEAQLQSIGTTVKQFEEQLRQDLSVNQMREGIVYTSFKTDAELERLNALKSQTRTFSQLVFSPGSVKTTIEPDSEAIEKHFSDNADQFRHPQRVKLEYIELNQNELTADVVVDEDELLSMYDDQKSNYVVAEQRRAAHILLTVNNDVSASEEAEKRQILEGLRARVLAGESFATLAEEYSEDPGSAPQGGDLGAFSRGAMVPEFEQVAFELQVGDVSEIVKSSFGFHLIKLEEIIPEQGKTFDQARVEIEQVYRNREAESLFFDASETLANEVYENSDTLETAAEVLNLSVIETEWLDADGRDEVFAYPAVKQAAFSVELLEDNVNSEVIEVGNNHIVVVRVREHRPARPKSLEEVSDEIISLLKEKNIEEELKASADQALQLLENGSSIDEASQNTSGDLAGETTISRDDGSVDRNISAEIFKMKKPVGGSTFSSTKTLSGGYAVLVLSAVSEGENQFTDEASSAESESLGQGEYASWLQALRDRADVTVNNQLLDDLSSQRP